MGRINTNINEVNQSSDIVTVTATGAILILAANARRTKISLTLPLNTLILSVIISATEAEANALKGEPIGQDFSANDNRFVPRVTFDTDSDSQGEKWAIVDSSLAGSQTSIDLNMNEYIG